MTTAIGIFVSLTICALILAAFGVWAWDWTQEREQRRLDRELARKQKAREQGDTISQPRVR